MNNKANSIVSVKKLGSSKHLVEELSRTDLKPIKKQVSEDDQGEFNINEVSALIREQRKHSNYHLIRQMTEDHNTMLKGSVDSRESKSPNRLKHADTLQPNSIISLQNQTSYKKEEPAMPKTMTHMQSPMMTRLNLKQQNRTQNLFSPHHRVRQGTGITGAGVAHMSPAVSGRLTLHMLHKMKKERILENQFATEDDNEFD